jgi:hypothetical protein
MGIRESLMAELYLRVVDKVNATSAQLDAQCMKRGDVVVICPDGWNWGIEELKSPNHRIIKMPGVPVEKLDYLLAPELPADPLNPPKTLKRRMNKIDVDATAKLSPEFNAAVADSARVTPEVDVKMDDTALAAAVVVKPAAVADPVVI